MAVFPRFLHEKGRSALISCMTVVVSVACAAPPAASLTPDHWSKEGYEWPPGSGSDSAVALTASTSPSGSPLTDPSAPDRSPSSPSSPHAASSSAFVPRLATPEPTAAPMQTANECLSTLRRLGVSFTKLPDLKGVENPVEVHGTLGGITFFANDGRALRLDCRLAVALENLRPVFRSHGVTRARFSGAYSYRTTRTGRLSHHALGLAIDIHEVTLGGTTFSVDADFARNVGCNDDVPTLNRLTCSLRNTLQFEEFLTPDFNADHRDHLHISVPRRRNGARF